MPLHSFSYFRNIELHSSVKSFQCIVRQRKRSIIALGKCMCLFFPFTLLEKSLTCYRKVLGLKLWDQACKMITLAILIKILISLHSKRGRVGGWGGGFYLSGMLGNSIALIKILYFRVKRAVPNSAPLAFLSAWQFFLLKQSSFTTCTCLL